MKSYRVPEQFRYSDDDQAAIIAAVRAENPAFADDDTNPLIRRIEGIIQEYRLREIEAGLQPLETEALEQVKGIIETARQLQDSVSRKKLTCDRHLDIALQRFVLIQARAFDDPEQKAAHVKGVADRYSINTIRKDLADVLSRLQLILSIARDGIKPRRGQPRKTLLAWLIPCLQEVWRNATARWPTKTASRNSAVTRQKPKMTAFGLFVTSCVHPIGLSGGIEALQNHCKPKPHPKPVRE